MKKLLTITIALCVVVIAMACGSSDPEVDGTTGATEQHGEGDVGTAKGKMLVVYFSRADENWQVGYVERGNTAIMVDYIKELADVDVFEIVPEVPYPAVYDECTAYVTEEINENRRPAYKNDLTNLADYEIIFIGGPVWWGRPPMLFRTFFEKHEGELDGKTIIPFGTHGGSGVGSYATLIKEYYPQATVLESLGISGISVRNASSKNAVENWLKKLGVDKQTTAVSNVQTMPANSGITYSLNGMRSNSQHGIQIRNGRKYISK